MDSSGYKVVVCFGSGSSKSLKGFFKQLLMKGSSKLAGSIGFRVQGYSEGFFEGYV